MQLPVEIENAFENGTTILTANVRAARWLRREYALRQREAGRRVWASPPIEDWDSWVGRLWQAYSMAQGDAPLLLTSLQERSVWTRMQREDAKLLVSPEGMAALAEEAYALLSDYEAHAERNHAWGQPDAERFRQWADRFDRECAKQRWVSRARIESLVAQLVSELPLPERVVMAGFDRITPTRERLMVALGARGVVVQVAEAGTRIGAGDFPRASPRLVRATDRRDEIAACARWIRGLLDETPLFESQSPVRIGVIVPELRNVRSEIERIFRRVLMPETDDVFASAARMPFEFSLGQPLASVPVIRAGLLLLRSATGPLSEEEVSWLLLSGYLSPQQANTRLAGDPEYLDGRDQGNPSPTQDKTGLEWGTLYLALARFDAELRNSGSLSLEISLRNVLWEMRRFPALADIRARLEALQRMAAVNHISEEERTPGRWVDLAQVLLDTAGWRSAARRDEIDFQARARWERLLDEIALLDFDGRRVSYRDFVEVLETQANETIFAPESHGAPVQVMGALEASGQQFDAVWFLGVDDQSWPARGRMHPLLPNDVQKRAGMPHATAEDDWELARVVTERIASSVLLPTLSQEARKDGASEPTQSQNRALNGAPGNQGSGIRDQVVGIRDQGSDPRPKVGTWRTHGAVVFSHAERDKDGELRPSPLIAQVVGSAHSKPKPGFEWGAQAPGVAWERATELFAKAGMGTAEYETAKLEEVTDASGVIVWPREECAGGYSVIRDQAACPFRAFAARRLNAEELNRSEWGLSAMERGRLLHEVMEELWSPERGRLHSLDDLRAAIAEGRLREVVEGAIGEVFVPVVEKQRGDAWMEAYLASEQRRLRLRLEEWLEIESKRVPFTVEATEKVLDDVSVGGLMLRLRADRVDRVAGGKRLLLDYKSGEVSTKGWEGQRPDEPQLPLYAVFGNVEDVAGVLFARIRVGETELEGCVSNARTQLFANVTPSSKLVKNPFDAEMQDKWTSALLTLAEDFLEGDARVDPKDLKKTCRYCAYPGLCRVAELRESLGGDDDADAGESDE